MASRLALTSVRSGSSESVGWRAGGVGVPQPSRLLIAAFVAFVASLPFEEGLVLGSEELVSVSRLLFYAFFVLALRQPRVCFRRPPGAIWWFAIYIVFYAVGGLFQPSPLLPKIYATAFRFSQLFVVLWVGYNLLRHEQVARSCLWGFGWACVAVAGLLVLGGSSYKGASSGRQTVFAQGVDSIAALLALGGSTRTRIRNAIIVVLALLVCYGVTMLSASNAGRWQSTLEEGNMSGRQRIYPAAWKMVEERPLLGWGPGTNYYELGYRLRLPIRDTHNLFLRLLTELGLAGTIPFCIGLVLCVRAAWRGRESTQGLLPLALIVASLTVNLSNTYLELKWFWVVLAYSLASETYLQVKRRRWSAQPSNRLEAFSRPGTARGHVVQRPA